MEVIFSSFSKIDDSTHLCQQKDGSDCFGSSSALEQFPSLQVSETIKLLKTVHSGAPLDPCPVWILEQIPEVIGDALTPLLNAIFISGIFPKLWKTASVLPLLKKQTLYPGDPNNYRPISRLPFPAKVLEKAMNIQLSTHLQTNNSLDPSQYGFRTNHSTELALAKSMEEIREALDRGGNAVLILLDLSAAFNMVHHDVLMDRLSEIGIKGQAWKLLQSFLSDRSQTVDLDGSKSNSFTLPCGVPQGSSLNPTLFNVYVAPLAGVIRSFGFQLTSYADDTKLCCQLKKPRKGK